jgi:hypothetical protein
MRRQLGTLGPGSAALIVAAILAACSAPAGAPPGGAGTTSQSGQTAGASTAAPTPTTAASASDAFPTGFTGTFTGKNTTSWNGTVTFHRVRPGTSAAECEAPGERVVYCYETTGGSVTWVTETGTGTFGLVPPDASGSLVLTISDSRHPDHAGTYEIGVSPTSGLIVGSSSAIEVARAWMNAIKFPSYPTDFHLSGREDTSGGPCGYEGCGPVTEWTWDLTATYDP